jgi:hypothetical protein
LPSIQSESALATAPGGSAISIRASRCERDELASSIVQLKPATADVRSIRPAIVDSISRRPPTRPATASPPISWLVSTSTPSESRPDPRVPRASGAGGGNSLNARPVSL